MYNAIYNREYLLLRADKNLCDTIFYLFKRTCAKLFIPKCNVLAGRSARRGFQVVPGQKPANYITYNASLLCVQC